jgi:hypothetical protein
VADPMTFSADASANFVVSVAPTAPSGFGAAPRRPRPCLRLIALGVVAAALGVAVGVHCIDWAPIIPVAESIFTGVVVFVGTLGASLLLRRAGAIVVGTTLVGFGVLLAATMHVGHSGFIGYAMGWLSGIFGLFTPMVPITMVACGVMLFFGAANARVVSAIGTGGASCLLLLCALYDTGTVGRAIAGISQANLGDLAMVVERVLLGIIAIGMSGIVPDDFRSAWLWAMEGATWPTIRFPSFRRYAQPKKQAYLPTARIVSAEVHDLIADAEFVESDRSAEIEYLLPPPTLLERSTNAVAEGDDRAADLERAFAQYGVSVAVKGSIVGPAVTQYRVEPAVGVKIAKLEDLEEDLARCLSAQSVRIAPIPGTFFVGVELPNRHRATVALGDMLDGMSNAGVLNIAVGKDISGQTVVASLLDMPHLLVAGATGAGKSVCLNSIIATILMRATPKQVRFLMVDPKRTELTPYDGIPHLWRPVITDAQKAAGALFEITQEMDARYELFSKAKVKKIDEFNAKRSKAKMPYIVVIIDELSDLMLAAKKTVEPVIIRLAQLGRAAGIHLIVATQRPDKDTITGPIKANIEPRIAFSVSDKTNSRIILDENGAEALLGNGDMLAALPKSGQLQRIQGTYVSSEEVEQIVRHWAPEEKLAEELPAANEPPTPQPEPQRALACDKQTEAIARFIFTHAAASKNRIMTEFGLGHAAVMRIIDELHDLGIVGPSLGKRPRKVLVRDEAELEDALCGKVVSHAG